MSASGVSSGVVLIGTKVDELQRPRLMSYNGASAAAASARSAVFAAVWRSLVSCPLCRAACVATAVALPKNGGGLPRAKTELALPAPRVRMALVALPKNGAAAAAGTGGGTAAAAAATGATGAAGGGGGGGRCWTCRGLVEGAG